MRARIAVFEMPTRAMSTHGIEALSSSNTAINATIAMNTANTNTAPNTANSAANMNAADSLSLQSLNLQNPNIENGSGAADSFFKTGIDVDDRHLKSSQSPYRNTAQGNEVRLPITVNLVALRETLFVEAPFVNKKNKAFWRKMLDGKHFSTILAAVYNFVSVCITESGNVLMDKLNDIQNSPLIEMIAATVTDMFYTFKRLDRDLFFRLDINFLRFSS